MPTSVKLLQNLLDYCAVKNKTIAKNISNIGTENYKREDVVFKNLLDENVNSFLKTSDGKHIAGLQTNILKIQDLIMYMMKATIWSRVLIM